MRGPQYGLSWPNTTTSIVYEGRRAAHGLQRVWAKTGIVPTVRVRDGWGDPWRDDDALDPAGLPPVDDPNPPQVRETP